MRTFVRHKGLWLLLLLEYVGSICMIEREFLLDVPLLSVQTVLRLD